MSNNPLLPSRTHTHIVSDLRNYERTATGPPTNFDDVTKGFQPGSMWFDTLTQTVYINISNATNNAVWTAGLNSVSNPSWLVPDWYVAPISGSDSNDGMTVTTPVQTIMGGIVSRWGTRSPILAQTTTIHLLEPETLGQESVVLSPVIVNGASFVILGTNIVVGTTTISAITTPLDPTAGTNLVFSVASAAGLSAGNLIYNTTRNSFAIIDAITGLDITATQPFLQAGLTTVTANPVLSVDNGWTAGDALEFQQSPLLNLKAINPQGGDAFEPVCWLENIFIPSTGGIGYSEITPVPEACSFVMSNCRLDAFIILNSQLIYILGQFQNTWLNGGSYLGPFANIMGGASNTAGVNYYGFFGGSADGNAILHGGSVPSFAISPGARFGQVNLVGSPFFVNAGATIQIFPSYLGSPIVWGSAQLRVNQNNAAVVNAALGGTVTWVSCLNLPLLTINGSNTAYAFDTGTATFDPVPKNITPSNLDTFTGLQNPLTGSRFAGPWPE